MMTQNVMTVRKSLICIGMRPDDFRHAFGRCPYERIKQCVCIIFRQLCRLIDFARLLVTSTQMHRLIL